MTNLGEISGWKITPAGIHFKFSLEENDDNTKWIHCKSIIKVSPNIPFIFIGFDGRFKYLKDLWERLVGADKFFSIPEAKMAVDNFLIKIQNLSSFI